MSQAFQLSVQRQLWRTWRTWRTSRVLSAAGPVSGRGLIRQLSGTDGPNVRSCTVDPNLTEQFVFLDCGGPEEDLQAEERELLHQLSLASSPPLAPPSEDPHRAPQKHLRSLERQLQVFSGEPQQEVEPDSVIQFQDLEFPVDEDLVAAKIRKRKKRKVSGKGEHKLFGTPDSEEPVSDTCCSGCGAVLHCVSVQAPGYLPSEKYKALQQEGRLSSATCQRCHLITHHHKALMLQVSRDQYQDIVRQIRPRKALVLLVIDLLDLPDSIIPDLPQLVGKNKHMVVLGNKIDLLPADSPGYLQRIKRQLVQYCQDAGFGPQVTDVHLISAKTGYGIETLISSLQRSWKYKGDVYLVGSANTGKSTLFNTLLESDYCKSKASEVIHKATISPWPGTTLDLLKFPIINPTPYRMFRRQERLNEVMRQTDGELKHRRLARQQGYLVGHVGRTFQVAGRARTSEIQFDPHSLAFGEDEDGETAAGECKTPVGFTFNELKDAHWLYDTPGIVKESDILNLLTEQEVRSVVPTQAIIPRTFVLKPGMSLFVGGVARVDFLQGLKSCWFSVLASNQVPVHITSLEKADNIYEKHAGQVLLGVPMGGSERMKDFPALVPQEFRLEGRGYLEASADIKLSSAGWVAVTAVDGDEVLLRVHGPAAAGFSLRTPPLLPHVVSLKGKRIRKSSAYQLLKTADGVLKATGAARLQAKKK